MNYIIVAVHLAALLYFALNYLRFNVGLGSVESIYKNESDAAIQKLLLVESIKPERPVFDRFAFVLLDAWRWNFLFNEETPMEFIKTKLTKGEALGTIALARIPTVTKPCLKSIFSGSLPVFFEIVENVDESGLTASAQASQDNILTRLHAQGKNICLYGDDVWTKLFPTSMFHRRKIDYGLNIMDYTKVDNMVIEGFLEEKKRADSDVLLFHMLGLDHIGHAFSARPDMVAQKLQEMDRFVSDLYTWLEDDDKVSGHRTLLLVMGDHGMTLDGNHGGGSLDETQAAAVFMSPGHQAIKPFEDWPYALQHSIKKNCHQEDLGATLTALLDTSGPLKNGHGKLIDDVVGAFESKDRFEYHLTENLIHLLKYPFKRSDIEVESVFKAIDNQQFVTSEHLSEWTLKLKRAINNTGFEYNEPKLLSSLFIMCALVIAKLLLTKLSLSPLPLLNFIALGVLALSQSTTSFIAEEHLLWQFIFGALFFAWFSASFYKKFNAHVNQSAALILTLHRVLSGWSSVGTLWGREASIAEFLKSHPVLQSLSVCVALFILNWKIIKTKKLNFSSFCALSVATVSALINRMHILKIDGPFTAQICLLSVLYLTVAERSSEFLPHLFIVLNRPIHSLAVALLVILSSELRWLSAQSTVPMPDLVLMSLIKNAYYSLGLWNSISAVDLTFGAAFTSSFDMRVAPMVLTLFCFSGPMIATIYSNVEAWYFALPCLILDFSACLFSYNHRFHPWIFDFFAPKIMFQVIWSCFFLVIFPLIRLIEAKRTNKSVK